MKIIFILVVALGSLSLSLLAITPEEILKKADEIRNPSESYKMVVSVVSTQSESSKFEVLLKGNQKTLIRTLEPSRDKGRNLLMIDEAMWAYIPNLKRAVRVALSQKLTGEAANGDIGRMRWSGDYAVTIKKEDKERYTLALKANKKGLTYESLDIVVDKKNFRPISADLYSVSGKLMKKANYYDYQKLAGNDRPSKMDIYDALKNDAKSTIIIEKMSIETFSETIFNQNALK